MKKENLRRRGGAVCLLIVFVLLLTLASCTKTAGSDTIHSKETLKANVDGGSDSSFSFVWQYLDEWEFPRFTSSKVKSVEVTFREKFFEDIPEASELSKKVAIEFLDNYYDAVELENEEKVTDAIINSYVSSLGDRYSIYRTKEEYNDYSSEMSGNYTGVGIVVTESDDGLILINDVLEGGSAHESGILAGDIITAVDGILVAERGYRDSIDAISGEEGTTVTLTVDRDGESFTFTLTRRRLVESSVRYSLEGGIGYIKISSFKSNTDEQFIEAINYMERNGAKGIIYDLRNNTGGYLSSVLNTLDYIAPKGTTLASFSNNYDKDKVSTSSHAYLIPSVVICNEMTASAGELFTAGIRDLAALGYLDATLVGTKTFGKGIMQATYNLTDGTSITVTVAYYMPTSGENYHNVGITPDVVVERSKTGDEQLDAAYTELQALLNQK
ncbi:MAG: S41 family peptidase [Clostridia bacterium]|nr:S41 family peptidase [Clostridia bacterium]